MKTGLPDNLLAQLVWHPYKEGEGPCFKLSLFDLDQTVPRPYARPGKYMLGYKLEECEAGEKPTDMPVVKSILFAGQDFGVPAHQSVDSLQAVCTLMDFLTVTPGDTEADYFATYTKTQAAFALDHAEALKNEVSAWATAQSLKT